VLLGGIDDVPTRWGQTPELIAPDGAGVVVETTPGRTDRYDLLLGADGVHSTVRQLVFDTEGVRLLGRSHPVTRPQRGRYCSDRSAFLTIPIGNGAPAEKSIHAGQCRSGARFSAVARPGSRP
jgi:2-polyprenyl-6-methoxyphenol hydroxylase-like FAD-dependent oxidoreductase